MHERPQGWHPRFKVGLETPLVGRFVREDQGLVFAPPLWYERLVLACLTGGPLLAVVGLFWPELTGRLDTPAAVLTGGAVFLAGVWALLSNERLHVDLKNRRYVRWEGTGLVKRRTKGSVDALDALVLLSEVRLGLVVHRLVLHWKGSAEPLLVVAQQRATFDPQRPLGSTASGLLGQGQRYAAALRVNYFDNSHFHSPEPVTPV